MGGPGGNIFERTFERVADTFGQLEQPREVVMGIQAKAWQMMEPLAPLQRKGFEPPAPGPQEALIEIAGCGVCHTDLGFLYGGVRTKKPLPLTLGHEISGRIAALGPDPHFAFDDLDVGDAVIVPAVLPCGECALCRSGRENVCQNQKMPGNDMDGGFATHVVVPARYLVPVHEIPHGLELAHLAVVADAVTTPYQALHRGNVRAGDPVIVIGAGGVGMYGVQIAAALGASVIAVDVDAARLEQAVQHGAKAAVNVRETDPTEARKKVSDQAASLKFLRTGWKVFEMSGTSTGQELAYSLLTPAGTLGIVGFTRDKISVRLSNLMAFDADAFGSWGCSPRHYRTVLDLIALDKIALKPFVSFHPLYDIQHVLEEAHHGSLRTRAVLVPGLK
jgi:6-hydroxycyclohex-1-ene-1-carbonyl-CoA dehydrogenase